jgi:hypothetical protein
MLNHLHYDSQLIAEMIMTLTALNIYSEWWEYIGLFTDSLNAARRLRNNPDETWS